MDKMRRFGDRLAFYRKAKGLTQKELAERVNSIDSEMIEASCHISVDRLGRIERARLEPTLSEILAFAFVLEEDVECLLQDNCNIKESNPLMDMVEHTCSIMDEGKRSEFLKFILMQAEYVNHFLKGCKD